MYVIAVVVVFNTPRYDIVLMVIIFFVQQKKMGGNGGYTAREHAILTVRPLESTTRWSKKPIVTSGLDCRTISYAHTETTSFQHRSMTVFC